MPADLQPCGSHAAYQRHVRAKEKPCVACSAENAVYVKVRRDARQAALRLLAKRHPVEFATLLEAARRKAGL
jgi:hypothetical protein